MDKDVSVPLVYNINIKLNLNDFDPKYPENPKTFGEKIRKARMDRNMLIKELALKIGVTEDTVINWEISGVTPRKIHLEKIKSFFEI